MDSSKTDRPERRIAIVARELSKYNIQIAALGETRFADKRQLTEVKADLNSKVDQLSFGTNGAEKDWAAFRDVVYHTAIAHLDQNTRKHHDWFDDNDEDIQKLRNGKREAFRSLQQDTTSASKNAAYNSIKSKVQVKLREMQDCWLSRKADEIQKYFDSNNSKHFYDALKIIYGPQSSGTSPLLSADGSTLLTDKNAILKRWAEHFSNVLNRPSTISAKVIKCMPQVTINTSLAEPPKESKVKEAIKLLPNGKVAGSDSIPAKKFKAGGPVLLQKLIELFQTMCQ
ncbi:hypothetical protein NDU88_001297 [Pleurodeles waltl]|uniref:Uncharacterized protein n=1 Tax=Pleurodeles waltl TaxID=8319 RepID=A0AAV7LH20_PLEWA|nr:hypothetical protein NDU88_001297 [Pleurodeles waltl]